MAFQETYNDSENLFEYVLSCDDLSSQQEIERTLDDYIRTLEHIVTRIDANKTDCFAIGIVPKRSWLSGMFKSNAKNAFSFDSILEDGHIPGEYDPWTKVCTAFWSSACEHAVLEGKIKRLLSRIEDVLRHANAAGRVVSSLWETDTVQFAEPLVSFLALHNRRYVPDYTKLLAQWDLDHEVHQQTIIDHIIRTHGMCQETEELLIARITISSGQHGHDQFEDLYPALQRHYGNFVKSPFFARIASAVYAQALREHEQVLEDHHKRVQREVEASRKLGKEPGRLTPPEFDDEILFDYFHIDDMKQESAKLFADLMSKNPPRVYSGP